MCETSIVAMRPANVLWRIAQGLFDDAVLTSVTLAVAWAVGVLPTPERWVDPRKDLSSVVDMLRSYLPLLTQIGATLFIYAALKFVYYTGLVAWRGQTLGCYVLRLRVVMNDGSRVSLSSSIKRAVAGGVISHTPVIGHLLRIGDYVVAIFNRRKRAARDLVADTMLVHVSNAEAHL